MRKVGLIFAALAMVAAFASPAQAVYAQKTQAGSEWDSRTCVQGADGDGSCWLNVLSGGNMRIWANDATHEVRWHFNNPDGCTPSTGCVVMEFTVANWGDPCGVGGADSSVVLFNGTTTKIQSRVNTEKDPFDRQCTISAVQVRWAW